MLSPGEARAQRHSLDRERERAYREGLRTTVRDLREQLRDARARRNDALVAAKATCRAARLALQEKAHERRKKMLAELRDTYARERAEARDACALRKAEVHAQARDPIERARGKWEAERKYQEDLRRIERGQRQRHREVHKAHADERRTESDEEVLANVPPDHHALWQRVKRSIKGSARQSRSEAFLAYAEAHPDELLEALSDDSDRIVRELEAKHAKAQREAHRLGRPARTPRYTPTELAEVPF